MQIVTIAEQSRLENEDYKEHAHQYFQKLTQSTTIDGYSGDSKVKYCNHSCRPNSVVRKWFIFFFKKQKIIIRLLLQHLKIFIETLCRNVDDQIRLIYVAEETILKDQEITVDYGSQFNSGVKCDCKEPNCKGWIGGPPQLSTKSARRGGPLTLDILNFGLSKQIESKFFFFRTHSSY